MISAISVKDRLKNQAREDGRTMQDELVTYGLERTIYRLSISKISIILNSPIRTSFQFPRR